jgi:hypothetical protein
MTRRPISIGVPLYPIRGGAAYILAASRFLPHRRLRLQMRGYAFARRSAVPDSIRLGLGGSKPIETAREPHFINANALKSSTQANANFQFAEESPRRLTARGVRGACFLYCEIFGGFDIECLAIENELIQIGMDRLNDMFRACATCGKYLSERLGEAGAPLARRDYASVACPNAPHCEVAACPGVGVDDDDAAGFGADGPSALKTRILLKTCSRDAVRCS